MRIVMGVLAIDQNQALVPDSRLAISNDFFVARVLRTAAIGSLKPQINAIVYTFIADVQRSKQYDSIGKFRV